MYRPAKKKTFLISLLIIANTFLLFQEIYLNQVLCHKPGGSHDLELAHFDYLCFCPHPNHEHTEANACNKSGPGDNLSSCPDSCRDEAIYSQWLLRLRPNTHPDASPRFSALPLLTLHFPDTGLMSESFIAAPLQLSRGAPAGGIFNLRC